MATRDDTAALEFLPLPEGPRIDLAEQAAGEIESLARTLRDATREALDDEFRFARVLLQRVDTLARVIQTALTHETAAEYRAALAEFESAR